MNKFMQRLMNIITINGKSTQVVGNNIKVTTRGINNSVITVNGVVIAEGLSGEVTIKFEGSLANLDAVHATINGNVHGNVDGTHVKVGGNIGGNVDATHVTAKVIHGKVDAVHVNGKLTV